MNAGIMKAIRALVDYNYADEAHDEAMMESAGEDTTGHIFHEISKVDDFLIKAGY